jgi:hypothetical protein
MILPMMILTICFFACVNDRAAHFRLKLMYGFLIHLPFYILNLPTILPLFLAGHFLYCAKLMPLSNVSNVWLRWYTGMCIIS